MRTRNQILQQLKIHKPEFSKFGIQSIGLFGSYIRNEQTENSDIDLLIDFEPGKATFDNLMGFHDIIDVLFKNEKVEIVTRNSLSPYIGPKILNEVQYA